jgi:peptidoglycan L-alanyl-D-glutamate endopeptidase CwlK
MNLNRQFTPLEERIIEELDEPFRSRFLLCAYRLRERVVGDSTVKMVVRDGWRDPAHQQRLYEKGRRYDAEKIKWVDAKDPLRPIVTNAAPGQSAHEYRRAAHLYLLDTTIELSPLLKNKDPRWELIGEVVLTVPGVTWGGAWKMRDLGHLEDSSWKDVARVRNWVGLGPKERLAGA